MRIVLTGATGFIGQALLPSLVAAGHSGAALCRVPAQTRLPPGFEPVAADDLAALRSAFDGAEVLISLAGESIAGRWTKEKRRRIFQSRVDFHERLRPMFGASLRAWISAGAVGYYGDRGADQLDERSPPGRGFLAEVCTAWESVVLESGLPLTAVGRFGVVLGPGGGALEPLRKLYGLGLGGPIGSGEQYFPWIHRADVVSALLFMLEHPLPGPTNLVAPEAVTQRAFAHTLGEVLGRPARLVTPKLAFKLALGEAAALMLDSQRVVPARLTEAGFAFRHPGLQGALMDILRP